ncbi:DUF4186 family protein [Spongiactinospora rosea]|uniref:DUF4186 family protein n=1 Tax=Spongiactinospora rosea TaxID=2248750 RepID=UPI001CED2FEB
MPGRGGSGGTTSARSSGSVAGTDRAVIDLCGISTVRRHAGQLVERRPTPAEPRDDGRQTPYCGHPLFVAQHATATCCRACLERRHDIPQPGRALDDAGQGHIVEADLLMDRGAVRPHRPPP